MTGEERAARSVKYLRNTDALGYEPEIEAEFQRVWNDAMETAAELAQDKLEWGLWISARILKLKVER